MKVLCWMGCVGMGVICTVTGHPESAHPYIAGALVITAMVVD
jgi:hypothetical protein